nr:PAS domain S-box protein [Armatimonadota bacterium]
MTNYSDVPSRHEPPKTDLLLDAHPDPMFTLDLEGRFTFVNQRAEQLLAQPREALLGRSVRGQMDAPADERLAAAARHTESARALSPFDQFFPTLDAWFEVRMLTVADGLLVCLQDVTLHRRAGEAIWSAEQKLVLHVHQTPLTMIQWDLNFCVTEWNPSAEETFGYSKAEAMGRHAAGLLVPEDAREHVDHVWNELLADRGGTRSTNENLTKDGQTLVCDWYNRPLLDIRGEIVGVRSLVQDITERFRAEEAVRRSEARYRALVEATAQIVWNAAPTGEFLPESTSWTAFTGQNAREFTGWGWTQAVHPEDWEHAGRAWADAVAHQTLFEAEFRLQHRDGGYRHVLARGAPVRDADRRIREWIGTCTDISQQKDTAALLESQYRREKRIARKLQRAVLLSRPEETFPGLSIETMYEAAWGEGLVGGDYVDTFPLPQGRVALVVGDIPGKGLAAATYTAEVKFSLRAFLREYPDPAAALSRLNRFLCDAFSAGYLAGMDPEDPFVFNPLTCLALIVIEPASGDVQFSAAGMEPPLILRAGGETEEVPVGGRPLGVLLETEFAVLQRHLEPGDTALLASNGITEARQGNFFFGYEGMKQAAHAR